MACLVAAALQQLIIASRAFFCVSRPTTRSDAAKRGLSVLGVTGRMAVQSRDETIATAEVQEAEVQRVPSKTVTRKDAEKALKGPELKQGSWTFKPRQSSNTEGADDDGMSELVKMRRAALRLPGPKEEAERAATQQRQEEVKEMYEINGSTDEFTVPEKIAYVAAAASIMWIWIRNAYGTLERFGSGPHHF